MDPKVVSDIQLRLDETVVQHRISVPLAVESGSRAWGFPSPDSDYDCRFVYLRARKDYAGLFPKRDVIELPLTPVFDINGWDLQKAIKLLLKGNAVILEWLQSPITYRTDEQFVSALKELADAIVDRNAVKMHYLYLLKGTLHRHFEGAEPANIKKLFYVLRPAMALRQLRLQSGLNFPEMNMLKMMEVCDLAPDFYDTVHTLVARKAKTRELGSMAIPPSILDFVLSELRLADLDILTPNKSARASAIDIAEHVFQSMLDFYGPS